jgi:glycosyltransferase involved in cell wall biosynthesis
MTILFLNNYPMDRAWRLWQEGLYPGHHLWGATELEKHGIRVEILPHERWRFLNRIGTTLRLTKYLDQQIRVLLRGPSHDLVLSGCYGNTHLLGTLRSLRLYGKPLAMIVHHPIRKSRLNAAVLGGHDRIFFLSRRVLESVESEFALERSRLELLDWGPDLAFYRESAARGETTSPSCIVSAGKTDRDYDTLIEAFAEIPYPLRIHCSSDSGPRSSRPPDHVHVNRGAGGENPVPYRELLREYESALGIAIPLRETPLMAGLTSLLDAMAVGKAVVMTRNPWIDIDIEAEGIGLWVEPGDVGGWRRAITFLLEHPTETREMGRRGRSLCESRYDISRFAAGLARSLADFR